MLDFNKISMNSIDELFRSRSDVFALALFLRFFGSVVTVLNLFHILKANFIQLGTHKQREIHSENLIDFRRLIHQFSGAKSDFLCNDCFFPLLDVQFQLQRHWTLDVDSQGNYLFLIH